MNKSDFLQNVKITVFIGYLLLFFLTVFGGYELYKQLIKFSSKDHIFAESKQLTLISNALVSLYETESTRKVMLSDAFRGDLLVTEYNAENAKVHSYVDSLYKSSNDTVLHASLDTVIILLNEKESNMKNMLLLTDSIKKLPYSKKILTSILSRKDIDGLSAFLQKNISRIVSDSSYYEKKKKKGFLAKLKDVFTDAEDSSKVIAKQNVISKDSTFEKPINLLRDTVVQYINDFSSRSDKKKALYLAKLSLRQEQMLYFDEMLSNQIHQILRNIETKERKFASNLLLERGKAIKQSSRLVSLISFASLFTLIIFMILSLSLINRSQAYKNKLEKSKQLAETLSKSRERLLLMISHDVKSPLSSIIGHIELLSKEKMPETEKTYISNMRNSSEHILELVNKLMDYHKLEQGKSEINKVSFSPRNLIDDIYNGFVPVTANKGLKYLLDNHINSNLALESDPFVIKQVVNNLISNAIKFTNKGSIHLLSSVSNEGILQVSVKDTGMGIKPEDKERIFDEFQRLGNTEQQHTIDGFGLGLAITYKLVQLLGGEIKLKSEYGKGSEFTVLIPSKPAATSVKNTSEEKKIQKTSGKMNVKILFVDDDITMLNVYKKLLTREGADVTVCSDSKKVLPLLGKNEFDILLTDIQMPQMNGFELIKKIRSKNKEYYKNLPVIALSARSDISEEKFKTEGFTAFLSKPIPLNVLVNKICEIINCNVESNKKINDINFENKKSINSIIEFVEDDKETALDILNVFTDENQIKIKELTSAVETNNWEQIKTTSHKLLPLMKMIGAEDIVSICLELENGDKNASKVKNLIKLVDNKNKEIADFIKNKYPEN